MKNLLKITGVVFFLILLNSCEKEEDSTIDPQEIEQESNTIKYVYGPIIKTEESSLKNNALKRRNPTIKGSWIKIDKRHLKELSKRNTINYTNEKNVKDRFVWFLDKGNRKPQNVTINDVKLGKRGISASDLYDWKAEIRVNGGNTITRNDSPLTSFKPVSDVYKRSQRNYTNKGKMMELPGQWRVETANTSKWDVSGSISFTRGLEVDLGFAKMSGSTTISLEAGVGGSTTRKITEVIGGQGTEIWVPAGKVGNWELVERHRKYKTKTKTPIRFKGYVGAHYSKKVDGYWNWAIRADLIFHEYTKSGHNQHYVIDVQEEYAKELRVRVWVTDN